MLSMFILYIGRYLSSQTVLTIVSYLLNSDRIILCTTYPRLNEVQCI